MGKMNGGHFRETNFFFLPHELFINYMASLSIILFKLNLARFDKLCA